MGGKGAWLTEGRFVSGKEIRMIDRHQGALFWCPSLSSRQSGCSEIPPCPQSFLFLLVLFTFSPPEGEVCGLKVLSVSVCKKPAANWSKLQENLQWKS